MFLICRSIKRMLLVFLALNFFLALQDSLAHFVILYLSYLIFGIGLIFFFKKNFFKINSAPTMESVISPRSCDSLLVTNDIQKPKYGAQVCAWLLLVLITSGFFQWAELGNTCISDTMSCSPNSEGSSLPSSFLTCIPIPVRILVPNNVSTSVHLLHSIIHIKQFQNCLSHITMRKKPIKNRI